MAKRLTNAQRVRYFGDPRRAKTVRVRTPWGITVRVDPKIKNHFVAACKEAAATSNWRPRRIDDRAVRRIRGRGAWSLHSWGLAFDFFATPPGKVPPGGVWTPRNGMPASFARAFERRGFTWGARWKRKDVPHVEWAGAPPRGGPAPAPAAKSGSGSRPTLRVGAKGAAVRRLQQRLNAHKVRVSVDGDFGAKTRAAVRTFQRRKKLSVDGVVGSRTWKALG